MNACEVVGITVEGEVVCGDCLEGKDEQEAFDGVEGCNEEIGVIFAGDDGADIEVCGRCNHPLIQ